MEDTFRYSVNCHCSRCRRTTGAACKPLAGIEADRLRVSRGETRTMRHGNDVTYDVHCAACGSLLCSVVRDGQYVHVAMGTLHDTPSIRPTAHIFVGSKAPITDDLPQKAGLLRLRGQAPSRIARRPAVRDIPSS